MYKKCLALSLLMVLIWSIVVSGATAQDEEVTTGEVRVVQIFYSEADVMIDDELVYPALAFTVATDFMPLDAGSHTLSFAKSGAEDAEPVSVDVEVVAGHSYTVLTMGKFEVESPNLVVVDQTEEFADYDPLGNTAIIVQNVPEAIPVDVWFLDDLKIENLTFGTYGTASAPLGEFTAQAVMVGNRDEIVFESHYFAVPNTVSLAYLSGSFPDGINRTFFTTTPNNTLDYLTVHASLENSKLSTFFELVQLAGMAEMFAGETQYTIFAPTNEAFATIDAAELEALKSDPEALKGFLSYHIAEGRFGPYELQGEHELTSLQGAMLYVEFAPPVAPVVNAVPTGLQHRTSNGVIYLVNTVLTPPTE